MTYTYTFKDGKTKDYTYEQILNNAKNFQEIGSGSLDAVTKSGLEAIANGGGEYSTEAKDILNFWNNSTAVENNYADASIRNAYSAGNTDEQAKVLQTELDALKNTGRGNGNAAYDKVNEAYNKITEPINYDKDGRIAAAYQAELDAIERTRQYTEELVAQAQEEAIRNAYTQYDKGRATYGQNAEQLSQMGLTNSGYGDYLEGVAYGSMVGSIQDANKTADEAIRNAYYNAEQSKAQAANNYNERLAEAEKAYTDNLVSVLGAVGRGEIDAATAETIAKAYGLNEADIEKIKTAATDYGTKVKENAIAYLDNAVKNGIADEYGNVSYLTEEQIQNYGKQNGLSEEEIEGYVTVNSNNIQGKKRSEIIDSIKSSDTAETESLVEIEKAKTEGTIDKETYEEAYFYNAQNLLECVKNGTIDEKTANESLKRWLDGKQLSSENYGNLKAYLDAITQVGITVDTSDIKKNKVTLNGNEIKVESKKFNGSEKEISLLDGVGGNVVRWGDDYFIKVNDTWRYIVDADTDDEFFVYFQNNSKPKNIVSIPKFIQ